MFQLRDYQQQLVDESWEWLQQARTIALRPHLLTQLPTGGGKTACQLELARREVERGGQVLIAVHRIEVAHQIAAGVRFHLGIEPEMVITKSKPNWNAPVLVAMNQTLCKRLKRIPGTITLMLQDEAHHAISTTYQATYNALPDGCALSGWTATPARLDGEPLSDVFDHLICGPSTNWLIKNGYLSHYRLLSVPLFITKGLRMKHGDYDTADVTRVNKAVYIAAGIVDSYRKHAYGKQTIVFAVSVAHSQQIAWSLAAADINAVHIDGSTPKAERERAIADFKAGRIQVLCNCELFGEGVDIPAVEVVILARPTKSLCIYLQQVGRSLRLAEGKGEAIILDVAQNYEEHGFPDDERRWTLAGRIVKGTGPWQESEFHEYVPREVVEDNHQLTEIASSATNCNTEQPWLETLDRLILRQESSGYKPAWIAYKLEEDPVASKHKEAWELLGQHLGYKPGWAWHKWRAATGQEPPASKPEPSNTTPLFRLAVT